MLHIDGAEPPKSVTLTLTLVVIHESYCGHELWDGSQPATT
jgi:hypothetical protein